MSGQRRHGLITNHEAALIVLPALSALIAFACVAAIGKDTVRRPTPDRIAWIVAFAMFGIAAGAEVIGQTAGWSAPLVRVYYLTGAVLVVGFLALGQLYLLAGDRIQRAAPGLALLVSAVAVSTVWGAPIDQSRLADDGWDAITRTTGLKLLAIGINSIGTLVLLGGLVYSAVRYKRAGAHRNRMIGCLLIALGTLTVAMGGTLTRFGSEQYLYIAMSAGIGLIFGGYVCTKRPEALVQAAKHQARQDEVRSRQSTLRKPETQDPKPPSPGLAFIEARLGLLSDHELSEECRIWSVPARDIDAFNRAEARRVWSFRNRLSPGGQASFDNRPPGLRLQLAEVYLEVMSSEIAAVERPPVSALERIAGRDQLADPSSIRSSLSSVD